METNPFYYQRVTDPAELKPFIRHYFAESGNLLTEEFLAKAIVYQFYEGPKAVAGFVLNTVEINHFLRTTSYLDGWVTRRVMFYEDLSEGDILEISANYKLKTLDLRRTMSVYAIMLNKAHDHAQQLNKTYILAGSVVKSLQLIHQLLLTRTVYFGPISADRQAAVKGELPLLKVYVSKVRGFRFRAMLALASLFLTKATKKRAAPAPGEAKPAVVAQSQPVTEDIEEPVGVQ
ncbi:hypothetical protein [Spirosoma arcticum]